LTVQEWKSDTYVGSALLYNVTLSVLDKQGTVHATTRVEGRDVLGSNYWNPASVAYTAAPQALKTKLEELLNHPEVIAALQPRRS
jgi:hypothetical protein